MRLGRRRNGAGAADLRISALGGGIAFGRPLGKSGGPPLPSPRCVVGEARANPPQRRSMSRPVAVSFSKPGRKLSGTAIAFAGDDLELGPEAKALGVEALVERAASAAGFKGKAMTILDLLAPAGTGLDRLIVVGTGKPADLKEHDWLRLGGAAMGALGKAKRRRSSSKARTGASCLGRGGGFCARHEAPRPMLSTSTSATSPTRPNRPIASRSRSRFG